MKLTFLGTGTSMGVPTAGGFGRDRLNGDPRNERWRCSAWIQEKDTSLIIDTGPEFRLQTLRAGIRKIDAVFITHEHMDHIAGLDDLRPFNYQQNSSIPLYSSRSCLDAIKRRFEYMFGPGRYKGATSVELREMNDTVKINTVDVAPLKVNHGKIDIIGFRLNKLSYLTDVKSIPEETKEKIAGSKVLVLSGLRWKPSHPTHLTIPEAVELATSLKIPKTYLIHMNSYVDYSSAAQKLPDHVQLAYDQLEVII